jgi:tetratricopeptide (TPR) repeat protein
MNRSLYGPLFFLVAATQTFAFSGNGRELMKQAIAVANCQAREAAEQEELQSMDKLERLQKAADLFKEALAQTTSPREKDSLERWLRNVYQQSGAENAGRKDYAAAAEAYQQAIEYAGDDAGPLHMHLGEMHFQQGDYYAAATSLEQAKEVTPEGKARDRVLDELAAAYMRDAQTRDRSSFAQAAQTIEERIAAKPGDQELLLQLAHVHELSGDMQKALDALERARQVGPLSAANEQGYQKMKSAVSAKRDFVRSESRHFVIEFDDKSHSSQAERFLELFEQAHDELAPRFGSQSDSAGKIFVNVYTSEQFGSAVRLPWAGALHQGNRIDLKLSPKWTDLDYSETILHEYTHHLIDMKAGGKGVPCWMHEGLAMRQEKQLDTRAYRDALRHAWTRSTLVPIAALADSFGKWPENQIFLVYGESYEFVGFLIEQYGMSAILKFLEALGAGAAAGPAFETAFKLPLADAESRWKAVLDEQMKAALARGAGLSVRIAPAGPTAPATATTR